MRKLKLFFFSVFLFMCLLLAGCISMAAGAGYSYEQGETSAQITRGTHPSSGYERHPYAFTRHDILVASQFDFKYIVYDFGFGIGIRGIDDQGSNYTITEPIDGNKVGMGLINGLYVKVPVPVWMFTVYPKAGLEAAVVYFPESIQRSDLQINENIMWLKFGGGIDTYLTERIFIRFEMLYGFNTQNGTDFSWSSPSRLSASMLWGMNLRGIKARKYNIKNMLRKKK